MADIKIERNTEEIIDAAKQKARIEYLIGKNRESELADTLNEKLPEFTLEDIIKEFGEKIPEVYQIAQARKEYLEIEKKKGFVDEQFTKVKKGFENKIF